ncbi:hypothetical protein F5X98DRAFT_349372 [Xylaria grammica]|nr:hypothetical protein F5X98DRAFT_349372 [Xylaria grammica]
MRLLQICDDGSLTLTNDIIVDIDIPAYTILSHTWGSDEQEVSFADMTAGRGKDKDGYRKIEFCRNQTQLDGFQYFWIDTCCIDKTNNNEFSEAINSMFRWYQRAAKCYVYLADVGEATATTHQENSGPEFERKFRDSKWFTRGWTLQELLAPFSVEFFGSHGQRLGSKQSLRGLIHEITGIEMKSLQGEPLSNFTVEQRMGWTKGRKTTRPEDKAYSLLGIFGAHMPLIYGEGEENAFERLRREIRRNYDWVLERLPIAKGSAFDSHSEEPHRKCQPNTRAEILQQVDDWMKDTDGKTIFWLNGMAGTGKSTIARTVASRATDSGHLGASFFFKRGERDRFETSKFFSTIAAQLARRDLSFAFHLKSALEDDFSICEGGLERQFESLILKPFSKTFKNVKENSMIFIVVDALDECESEENVKQIIDLFSRASDTISMSPRLRIFATSRPDIPIRLGFEAVDGTHKDLVLHEVPEPVIRHDLSIYFQCELETIRNEYNRSVSHSRRKLQVDWPGSSDFEALVHMATPLFIFAATVCRFLADRRHGNPDKNLQKVLRYRTRSQESKMDNTYRPVLDMMLMGLSRRERMEAISEFRVIVGSILVLAEPLSASALATLIDVPQDTVDDRLDMFHSVLDIPSVATAPVRLLHLSFRDFLTDPEKREQSEFWIDEGDTHKTLASRCLQIMDSALRKNICGKKWPGESIESFDKLKIQDSLSPEVTYACQHWAHHLKEADDNIRDDQVYGFLKRHFLHWLEALALVGKASRSIEAIESICQSPNLQGKGETDLSKFLAGARLFITENLALIESAPLQVYYSALIFAPEGGIIKEAFRHELPKWVRVDLAASTYRNKDHAEGVTSISCSHQQDLVASGSWDSTVCLRSITTGALQHKLKGKGQTGKITVVNFSPDGELIASGSEDGTVQLWSTDTGALRHTLWGHESAIVSIAFSHVEHNMVATGSYNKVRIWRIDTGALYRILAGDGYFLDSIVFSHDSQLVASGWFGMGIRIWETDSGTLQQILKGRRPADLLASSRWDGRFSPEHADALYHGLEIKAGEVEIRQDWITLRGENLIQLPIRTFSHGKNTFPIEVSRKILHGSTAVVGYKDGTVTIIPLNLQELQEMGIKEL